ncbi:MAG: type IV pilus twitching motility protein PilT [Bacillota bacterium]
MSVANEILMQALIKKASDIHITVGVPPVFRLHGELVPQQEFPVLGKDHLVELVKELLDEVRFNKFTKEGELDFAYSLPSGERFRVNAFHQKGNATLAVRVVNSRIPALKDLHLPSILEEFTRKTRGLVLVTGPTGSGKSTTLAAMIDLINNNRSCHIITLEDPIEYVHQHKRSVVNQREVGSDTRSFSQALRAALRQDPDVILVGEMRDLETISIAITAAETGHLVFATLHTSSAAQTVDRIIDVFPPYQQQQVRVQLAETLQGIVAQQLVPRIDKPGRVAAVEVMVATPAIKNQIREGKTHQILSTIQTGGKFGMQSLDSALLQLGRQGTISKDEVLNRCVDGVTMRNLL